MVIFKLIVREYRHHQRLTQKQLAQRSGISKSYISDIERGHIPSLPTLEKIANGLGICMNLLIVHDNMNCTECAKTTTLKQ